MQARTGGSNSRSCDNFVMIEVIVNGERHALPPAANVATLVESLGLTGRRIAVERNGEIVPHSRHANEAIANGDRLEIVVAVGGG